VFATTDRIKGLETTAKILKTLRSVIKLTETSYTPQRRQSPVETGETELIFPSETLKSVKNHHHTRKHCCRELLLLL